MNLVKGMQKELYSLEEGEDWGTRKLQASGHKFYKHSPDDNELFSNVTFQS